MTVESLQKQETLDMKEKVLRPVVVARNGHKHPAKEEINSLGIVKRGSASHTYIFQVAA